jgi:four helix bundle protein
MALAELVYRLTSGFPKQETYGLTAQMRRAAVSVPSNIAEGQGRRSDAELRRSLLIAHGSLRELETQIILATRLALLPENEASAAAAAAAEVGRLINGLLGSVGRSLGHGAS